MAGSPVAGSAGEDTFPKILLRNARVLADRPAMREKDLGIWQVWSWAEVLEEIRSFAIGLQDIGFAPGDRIAIIGANRPRLYWSMVAAQSLGGVPVPLYADSVAEEMAFVLEHAEVRFACVEDQEQVDKVVSMSEELPRLEQVIYDDPRGLRDYDHTRLHSFEAMQEKGRAALAADPGREAAWLSSIEGTSGTDIAVMLYTSGTTGRPKGVMLSFDNLVKSARNGNAFDGLDESEETLAYLPMAWIGDHVFSLAQAYTAGYCVNCPESMETVLSDRREIAPTYFFAPPRVFEGLLTLIMVRMEDAGRLKKRMFDYFMGVARRAGEKILNGVTNNY